MRARIYQPPKNAMQSGRAGTHEWVLEFERLSPQRPDPLMGWIGSSDTQQQVRLTFATREEAVAYAEKQGSFTISSCRNHGRSNRKPMPTIFVTVESRTGPTERSGVKRGPSLVPSRPARPASAARQQS